MSLGALHTQKTQHENSVKSSGVISSGHSKFKWCSTVLREGLLIKDPKPDIHKGKKISFQFNNYQLWTNSCSVKITIHHKASLPLLPSITFERWFHFQETHILFHFHLHTHRLGFSTHSPFITYVINTTRYSRPKDTNYTFMEGEDLPNFTIRNYLL